MSSSAWAPKLFPCQLGPPSVAEGDLDGGPGWLRPSGQGRMALAAHPHWWPLSRSLGFWMSSPLRLPFGASMICESGWIGVLADLKAGSGILWGRVASAQKGVRPPPPSSSCASAFTLRSSLERSLGCGWKGCRVPAPPPRAVYTAPTLVIRPWHQEELLALTGCVLTLLTHSWWPGVTLDFMIPRGFFFPLEGSEDQIARTIWLMGFGCYKVSKCPVLLAGAWARMGV